LTHVTPVAAATCRPTPSLLSRPPSVTRLASGATARVWDTGPTPRDPQASTRIVAVEIPAGTSLKPRVFAAPSLTSARTPSTYQALARTPVVMVNGGVFDPARGALPVLPQMVGGVVHKASLVHEPAITIAPDGRSSPDHLWIAGAASAGGRTASVTGLNWQSVIGSGVNVYTPGWGAQRRPSGTVDVVVTRGRVAAVRTGAARGSAPAAGQMILTATGATGAWLARLRPGAAIAVSYRAMTDATHPVRDAVGRGARYVLQGRVQGGGCAARDELLRPRTAVGWTRSGSLLLVTVSGRATVNGVRYGGATIHQMADYMARLGSYEATALDGGGSTTMLVRRASGGSPTRMDRGSSEAQRPVPNVLAVG
jgi:hypothetical protein